MQNHQSIILCATHQEQVAVISKADLDARNKGLCPKCVVDRYPQEYMSPDDLEKQLLAQEKKKELTKLVEEKNSISENNINVLNELRHKIQEFKKDINTKADYCLLKINNLIQQIQTQQMLFVNLLSQINLDNSSLISTWNQIKQSLINYEGSKIEISKTLEPLEKCNFAQETEGKLNKFKTDQQLQVQSQMHQLISQLDQPAQQLKFKYQLRSRHSTKNDYLFSLAFNQDATTLIAGFMNKKIEIYDYKGGTLRLKQQLYEGNGNILCLYFMRKSASFVSGSSEKTITIWQQNNNQWVNVQKLEGHQNQVRCLLMNRNEDIIISASDDCTIKFWERKSIWSCSQTLKEHFSSVLAMSLNDSQNKLIFCVDNNQILLAEYQIDYRSWSIQQTIIVECWGRRLSFIGDNQFTFQQNCKEILHVYERSQDKDKSFIKTREIQVKAGTECSYSFPQKFIKAKSILVNKNGQHVNLVKLYQNGEFVTEQSIDFGTDDLTGVISDDGEYLATWDYQSREIQIRQFQE